MGTNLGLGFLHDIKTIVLQYSDSLMMMGSKSYAILTQAKRMGEKCTSTISKGFNWNEPLFSCILQLEEINGIHSFGNDFRMVDHGYWPNMQASKGNDEKVLEMMDDKDMLYKQTYGLRQTISWSAHCSGNHKDRHYIDSLTSVMAQRLRPSIQRNNA